MTTRGRPKGITEIQPRAGPRGRPNFSAWARTVIEMGRAYGHSEAEISKWIKVYARKRKIPRGTIGTVLSKYGVHIRQPYRIRAASRAALHQKNNISPKMRFHADILYEEINKWLLSIVRTLEEASEQGEDINQAKREIMEPIKRDWNLLALSKIFSLEEFIKRTIPELLEVA